MVAWVHPGPAAYWQFRGFFILSQLPAWAKKAPRTCRKRGAGPLSDRKSQSIVRLSKDQGGSSVLLDTPAVNCVFNRRQYNFVIGPIPVLYAQATDAFGLGRARVRRCGCIAESEHPAPLLIRANALEAVTVGAFVIPLSGPRNSFETNFFWTKPHFGFSFEQYLCSR